MYTEIILGAELKNDTPKNIINALKYITGIEKIKPKDFPLPDGRCEWLLQGGSCSFAINKGLAKMWFDNIGKQWIISARANIKNSESEIETFLDWLKPYIKSGSGAREMYAIVMYEEQIEPDVYYLDY